MIPSDDVLFWGRHKNCPRCSSKFVAIARPRPGMAHYQCRHAWHMPSVLDEAQAALDFVAETDRLFSGDIYANLPAQYEAETMSRTSTCGYP